MSNHEDDVENVEHDTRTIRVILDERSIEEIQLCLRFSNPKGTSKGLLKSTNENMQRLSLEEADKGSRECDELCEDTDESVSSTIQGLNRPSFQPSRRLGDGLVFKCGEEKATHYQRFAANGSYETEEYDD